MRQQREITLRIYCHDLPGGHFHEKTAVRLGIQKGREVIDDVPADAETVTFTATFQVGDLKTGQPNFLGPYAHGKPESRFLYLSWGERKNEWEMFGRAKVPLAHLDWDRLDKFWRTGEPILLSVSMTDARGRPVCGTVKMD